MPSFDIFHPKEPFGLKSLLKITTLKEARQLYRATFFANKEEKVNSILKGARFLDIHSQSYIVCTVASSRPTHQYFQSKKDDPFSPIHPKAKEERKVQKENVRIAQVP
jgi:hypothetical protein